MYRYIHCILRQQVYLKHKQERMEYNVCNERSRPAKTMDIVSSLTGSDRDLMCMVTAHR